MLYIKSTSALLISSVLLFTSCSKSSDTPAAPPPPPTPTANFTFTGAGLAPATVQFTNTSTNSNSYSWDFGDNTTSSATNPTHTYTRGGVYTVRLTATGAGGSNSITKTVNIQAPTSLRINTVSITDMSFLNPRCVCGWDNNSGPDVYFELTDVNNNVLATGGTINDVTAASIPLLWNFTQPFPVTNLATTYKINVWDDDGPNQQLLDPDRFIGGYTFNFNTTSYPANVVLQSPTSNLRIVLGVQWQ
jgi:PKD repeat protein